MNCEEALLLISGHIDQENTPEEEAQLQLHLEQCARCREVLQAFLDMDCSLTAVHEEPPADLRQNVMDVIRAENAAPKKQRRRWVSHAVAAALAIVIGASAMPRFTHTPSEADVPMARRFVPMAVETLSADPSAESVQELADTRQAAIVIAYELYPELEVCECETLESGALLYCLDHADAAEALSDLYELELFLPEQALSDVSYALLLPPQ